jgi:hypothetical protein
MEGSSSYHLNEPAHSNGESQAFYSMSAPTNVHHGYHSYYGNSEVDSPHNQVYDAQWSRESVDQIEEHRELHYQQQVQHQLHALDHEGEHLPPAYFGGKPLPNMIISLAQQLLPTVVQRLRHQDQHWEDDDFEGHCAPLGNSSSAAHAANEVGNFKTTGLEDEQSNNSTQGKQAHPIQHQRKISDLEMGDPTEYLPQSAALLITALQNSVKKDRKRIDGNTLLEHLPSLMNEAAKEDDAQEFESGVQNIDNFEREAEALLESIRRDDLRREVSSSHASIDGGMDHPAPSYDDDDSIGGDMVRLSQSIAFLQHDLENVDMSHFDQLYDDGFGGVGSLDGFEGEGSAWARMKMWFSRGMIMEQKLLNSYTNMGDDSYGNGADTTTRSRYADNPVLIWSLAIMWAFVLLIMGHSKIAEWVEGEDPGRLADIIEWLFS